MKELNDKQDRCVELIKAYAEFCSISLRPEIIFNHCNFFLFQKASLDEEKIMDKCNYKKIMNKNHDAINHYFSKNKNDMYCFRDFIEYEIFKMLSEKYDHLSMCCYKEIENLIRIFNKKIIGDLNESYKKDCVEKKTHKGHKEKYRSEMKKQLENIKNLFIRIKNNLLDTPHFQEYLIKMNINSFPLFKGDLNMQDSYIWNKFSKTEDWDRPYGSGYGF